MTYTPPPFASIDLTIPGHGVYRMSADVLDLQLVTELPSTNQALRAKAEKANGADYSDIHSTVALLALLALPIGFAERIGDA